MFTIFGHLFFNWQWRYIRTRVWKMWTLTTTPPLNIYNNYKSFEVTLNIVYLTKSKVWRVVELAETKSSTIDYKLKLLIDPKLYCDRVDIRPTPIQN